MGNQLVTEGVMSGDKKANKAKLKAWKKKWGLKEEDVESVVSVATFFKMKDGRVTSDNYIEALDGNVTDRELARRYFNACDTDRSGVVSEDELLEFYGIQYGEMFLMIVSNIIRWNRRSKVRVIFQYFSRKQFFCE